MIVLFRVWLGGVHHWDVMVSKEQNGKGKRLGRRKIVKEKVRDSLCGCTFGLAVMRTGGDRDHVNAWISDLSREYAWLQIPVLWHIQSFVAKLEHSLQPCRLADPGEARYITQF